VRERHVGGICVERFVGGNRLADLQVHRFRGFEVRPAQRQLLVEGQPAVLGARAFDLLLALIERPGTLVSRHELLDAVWPGLVVEENNLAVQVGTLRKLLGAEVIATIPGRGYRFTAAAAGAAGAGAVDRNAHPAIEHRLRTNLPEVLPTLIGRDDDIAALGALIAQHRLVTITGAGGMGKSRLGERLLHDRRDTLEHGVVWVELAALSDPALLPGSITGALGLQIGGADPLRGLVAALAPLQILVALDNAEHLVDAVAQVVQALIDGTSRLQLLVTSQTPLRLATERVYRLGALELPDANDPWDDALGFGAVALFVERARAADHRFEVNAHTLPGIVDICAQLDGVPLAIELAAARVPMLGVAALAAALDESLRLLTQGRRGAPERQRTLRAALEWSHGLLDEVQAAVFRRLGVFVGGFSLEMARQVAADDDSIDEWVVVDTLGTLVDRSLVVADTSRMPRYRLLESARAVALEKLAASGESVATRRRHAQAALQRLTAIDDACMAGRIQVDDTRQLLEADLDNARAALAWMQASGDALGTVKLAPQLGPALTAARHQERAQMWEATAACLDDDMPAAARADWASAYSTFCADRKPESSAHWARTAVLLYRQTGDDRGVYRALGNLCIATARLGYREESAAAHQEMTRLESPAWSPRLRTYGAEAGYFVERFGGDFEAACRYMEHKEAIHAACGDTINLLTVQVNLADLDLQAGRIDDAVRRGRELERLARGTRHLDILDFARRNLTAALVAQGAIVEARAMAQAAWPLAVQFDFKHCFADYLSELAMREHRADAAARLLGYSEAIYAAYGSPREPNEAQAAERAERTAREQLGDVEFERLLREGRALHDDSVLAIALGTIEMSHSAPQE
jgi:predicted ATPase/DNA-binding winged helix-turn-helix (wHTH) protein